MAEQFSMPSMFDTQYGMDRQMELDAQKAGQIGGGSKRYGMYYNSSLLGDRDNASLMSLTGMLGGQGDPRIAKQNAIDSIMQQYPNPEKPEDFTAIGNALRTAGLYDEAARADKMASDMTTEALNVYKAQTDRMNALSSSTTANTKAPTRDETDYIKTVDGKQIVYTKTEQYDSKTKTWAFVSEAPKYAPDKPTATMQDLMSAAKVVDNKDGTYGCDLNNSDCWIKATAIYHATTTKETTLDASFSEVAGEGISKQFQNARKASENINTIDASFNALNSGDPITGFAANMRLGLAKMIGAVSGDEDKDVQATEVWLATTGKLVAELLASGAFGAGTGLSDNDLKFAKAMVGGDVNLDEGSIRRILYIRRQLENLKINNWNAEYELYPELVQNNLLKFYAKEQIIQDSVPWDTDNLYMKPPTGFFIYKETEYFWPATEYDVDKVIYDGKEWTVHNKNGFDLTREYIDNLAQE